MYHAVIRRVERLALPFARQYGGGAVVLVAHYPAIAVLERDLPSLAVEGVAVAVARGLTEDADMRILFQPTKLHVRRDVAPDEIPADSVPGRTFDPAAAGVQALYCGIAQLVARKARLDLDDVCVGIAYRRGAAPVALIACGHP